MAFIYKRNHTYWVSFTHPLTLRRVQKSLHTKDKKIAKEIKADIERRIALGEFHGGYERNFSSFLEEYFRYINIHLRPLSVKRYREDCNAFIRFLESERITDIKLEDISPVLIERYKAWRLEYNHPATVNQAIVNLKTILNLAVKFGYLKTNPIKYVEKIPLEKRDKTFLSAEEFNALLKCCAEDLRPMVQILGYTGLRRNELANLLWKDIDLINKMLYVRNREGARTKTRKERMVPLNNHAIEVLQALPKQSNHVFDKFQHGSFRKKGLRRQIVSASKRAGIDKHITTHTLRHTFASHLAMQGKSILIIARLLGVTVDTAQIYAHLLPHQLHDVVSSLPY